MEIEKFTEAEALEAASYPGLVAGRADAWQMDGATCLAGDLRRTLKTTLAVMKALGIDLTAKVHA